MAVALAQNPAKTINNLGTSPQTVTGLTTSSGSLILVVVMGFGTGAAVNAPTSVKLDNTTTMTADVTSGDINTSSNFHMRVSIYSLPNVASGAHTATVVWPATIPTNTLYFFVEVSGAATASVVDGTGASGSGVGTAAATGAASSTNGDDFWIAATTSLAANPATFTAGAGWTIPTGGTETNSAANLCGGMEYIANPGATSENGQFTLKTGDWVASVIAYKAAAGGGTRGLFMTPSLSGLGGGGSFFRDPLASPLGG